MPTTLETTISSLELIRLINHCRERQSRASGVSFPSQTFPRIEHSDIEKKLKELLGDTSQSGVYIFSQRQAYIVCSSYGPLVQAALFDFFKEHAVVPKAEPAATPKQVASNALTLPGMEAEGAAARRMTSREIAELTGKPHAHVLRDLRTIQSELGAMFGGHIQPWIHPQNGQEYEEFVLNKDTCLMLVGRYKLKPQTMTAFMEFFRAGDAPVALYQGASTEENVPSFPVRKAKIELPIGGSDGVSMSSLEISELTGSRHAEGS